MSWDLFKQTRDESQVSSQGGSPALDLFKGAAGLAGGSLVAGAGAAAGVSGWNYLAGLAGGGKKKKKKNKKEEKED